MSRLPSDTTAHDALPADLLLRGYALGLFPMADDRDASEVFWVEPEWRATIPLDGFHLSRSLRRVVIQDRFRVTTNQAFGRVVALCAEPAPDRPQTWINAQIERAYGVLHANGHAHSVECWRDENLVGGLYGVSLGRAFFGESMVSRATDASKVALAHLVARLKFARFTLLDCQFMTDHLASLGAVELSRSDYLVRLQASLVGGAGSASFGALDASSPSSAGVPGKLIAQLLT